MASFFFTLTSDTTSVIVRWGSMVESERSNPRVSMDEVCKGMIASVLYCSVRSKKHEGYGGGEKMMDKRLRK